MDQKKISQFTEKFRTLESSEFADLVKNGEMLAEEAKFALDAVLTERGVSKDILAKFSTQKEVAQPPIEPTHKEPTYDPPQFLTAMSRP